MNYPIPPRDESESPEQIHRGVSEWITQCGQAVCRNRNFANDSGIIDMLVEGDRSLIDARGCYFSNPTNTRLMLLAHQTYGAQYNNWESYNLRSSQVSKRKLNGLPEIFLSKAYQRQGKSMGIVVYSSLALLPDQKLFQQGRETVFSRNVYPDMAIIHKVLRPSGPYFAPDNFSSNSAKSDLRQIYGDMNFFPEETMIAPYYLKGGRMILQEADFWDGSTSLSFQIMPHTGIEETKHRGGATKQTFFSLDDGIGYIPDHHWQNINPRLWVPRTVELSVEGLTNTAEKLFSPQYED